MDIVVGLHESNVFPLRLWAIQSVVIAGMSAAEIVVKRPIIAIFQIVANRVAP